ncbi:hypothetical protein EC960428_2934, partial [Escherichia coli 96.0428]
LVCQW